MYSKNFKYLVLAATLLSFHIDGAHAMNNPMDNDLNNKQAGDTGLHRRLVESKSPTDVNRQTGIEVHNETAPTHEAVVLIPFCLALTSVSLPFVCLISEALLMKLFPILLDKPIFPFGITTVLSGVCSASWCIQSLTASHFLIKESKICAEYTTRDRIVAAFGLVGSIACGITTYIFGRKVIAGILSNGLKKYLLGN